ncbi:MAG: Secreted protein, partial [uncultured Pseudonocardia sp.]
VGWSDRRADRRGGLRGPRAAAGGPAAQAGAHPRRGHGGDPQGARGQRTAAGQRPDHAAPGEHPAGARRRHHLQRPHRHQQRVRADLAVHGHAGWAAGARRRVLLRAEQGREGPAGGQGRRSALAEHPPGPAAEGEV